MDDAASRPASDPPDTVGLDTRSLRAGLPAAVSGRPFLDGPVLAATYHLHGDPTASEHSYGRYSNPTWNAYEAAVGELDGGQAVLFSSGMAAVTAVLGSRLRPGQRLVLPSDCYYTTRAYATAYLSEVGVEIATAPTASPALVDLAATADLLWLETPSNPSLDACDIAALAEAGHGNGAFVVVDNTTATALGQRPLTLGADAVVTSDSKSTAGHSDVMLGHVTCALEQDRSRLAAWRNLTGAIPGPHETWLAHRSLATLGVRYARQCQNAMAAAQVFAGHPAVLGVRYPGLPHDPAYPVASRQMTAFGCVVSFNLANPEAAVRFLSAAALVDEATSFGGTGSTAERRARWGGDAVPPGMIRFSAGLENTADLVADLTQALDGL